MDAAHASFKINIRTGEIEISGSEVFVEKQISGLAALCDLMMLSPDRFSPHSEPEANTPECIESQVGLESVPTPAQNAPIAGDVAKVGSLGEWLHMYKSDLADQDVALLTARYIQSKSPTNDFKTYEVNGALKDQGIKLANVSTALLRLDSKKLIFQTRKDGKLRFMRVSVDGQKHIETLRRSDTPA